MGLHHRTSLISELFPKERVSNQDIKVSGQCIAIIGIAQVSILPMPDHIFHTSNAVS